MCNLYQMTPKTDLEVFIRQHLPDLFLPGFDPSKPVGPNGTGLFLRLDSGVMRGELGQWGMIRHKSPPPKPGEKRYNTNNARIESRAYLTEQVKQDPQNSAYTKSADSWMFSRGGSLR